MNHETAHELLPWLLTGTLDPAERDEVRAHLETCEACRRELDETRQAMDVFDQHLPSHDLVARAEGRETELPAATIDAHLESCPECSEELALLMGSLQAYGDAPDLKPSPPASRRTVAAYWRHGAVAAALVALASLALWVVTWQSLSAPGSRMAGIPPTEDVAVNARVLDLYPGESVVRGLDEPVPQGPGEGSGPMVLLLNSGLRPEQGPFFLEVVDAEDNVLKRQEKLPWPELGVFNVVIPGERPRGLTIRIGSAEGAVETYHLA